MNDKNNNQGRDQKPKAGVNKWSFSGKVEQKTVKFSTNGNQFANVRITIPAKNAKFTTKLFLKAFRDKAQEIEDNIKEGENYSFWGYVSTSSYEKDGQKVYSTDFIINGFTEADEADYPAEQAQAEAAPAEDKVPF